MSDLQPKPAAKSSQSSQFNNGDVTIRSSDGVLFHLHKANLGFASEAFPPATSVSSESDVIDVIDFAEHSDTLETLFLFVYPSRPRPNLSSLSFEKLMRITEAADKWGLIDGAELCRFHLRAFAYDHPKEILQLAGKQDCDFLVAAVAPYLIDMPINAVASLGVSSRICVKWGMYREKWIFALIEGQKILTEHDECTQWRKTVKPFLRSKIDIADGINFLPAKGYKGTLGVYETYRSVMELIRSMFGEDSQPCCRAALEKWQSCTLDKLEMVYFPN